jgi:predicted metal-dependent phosphoesterase TrpH
VIDLHLHTTASDGRLPVEALVQRAGEAGITVMSVTDHDTVAAVDDAVRLGAPQGIRVVPGIEVTAVHEERDVHVLGYFLDHQQPALAGFLQKQRALRVQRVLEIAARLESLGAPVDADDILRPAAERPGASVGRPLIAKALVAAGHVATIQEAFNRFLAAGQPGFVPRTGFPPADVVAVIRRARGVASLAHPGVTRKDALIPSLADAGLDALEVFHSDHTPAMQAAYQEMAGRLGLAVSGGSDFHGYGATRDTLGVVFLPRPAFDALEARVPR